jgi:hypothetical protein
MVYIGELDKSNGVSEKVAKAIKYIADNLDQLVSTLTFAAQAFIAYKAIGMAAVFLEKANSVRAASVAIQQETVALTTNTQAQLVNANAASEQMQLLIQVFSLPQVHYSHIYQSCGRIINATISFRHLWNGCGWGCHRGGQSSICLLYREGNW